MIWKNPNTIPNWVHSYQQCTRLVKVMKIRKMKLITYFHTLVSTKKENSFIFFYTPSGDFPGKTNKKRFMVLFYGWCSMDLKATKPLRGGSDLFTTQFPGVPSTRFIELGRMKDWVDLGSTQRFCTQDPWIGNPVP